MTFIDSFDKKPEDSCGTGFSVGTGFSTVTCSCIVAVGFPQDLPLEVLLTIQPTT